MGLNRLGLDRWIPLESVGCCNQASGWELGGRNLPHAPRSHSQIEVLKTIMCMLSNLALKAARPWERAVEISGTSHDDVYVRFLFSERQTHTGKHLNS